MDQKQIRITDAITSEYSDFLSYCIASGKVFVSELSNVDFVAFRTSSGQTRDYVRAIRAKLDDPIILENKHPEKDISLLCEEEAHTSSSLPIRMESEIIDTASADIEGFLNDDIDSAVLQMEPTDTQPEISAVGAEALSTKAISAETNMLQQTGDKESNQLCVAAPSTIFLDEPVGEPEISLAKLLAGLILLGNIDFEQMDVNQNMFKDLPDVFHESALLDRFHGFIKGWNIPKMKESLKANGWALNTEYFGEIMYVLRDELSYRAVVDQLLQLPKNSATRDTEAIKRICTGYLKLLFPDAIDVSNVDVSLFETYCLVPAMEMRRVIKTQLGIIDQGEFGGMAIPEITIKEQYREK